MKKDIMMQEMLHLQDELNIATNGKLWRLGTTKDGRKINWNRCIAMETAEAINSFGSWKHWKDLNAKTDYENLYTELVDICHFILSDGLTVFSVNACTDIFNNTFEYEYKELTTEEQIEAIERLFQVAVCDATKTLDKKFYIFFKACEAVGLTFEDLYKRYLIKNLLNGFRQKHGYKDGTYVKVVNGKEDNVTVLELAKELEAKGELTYNKLYKAYESWYNWILENRNEDDVVECPNSEL